MAKISELVKTYKLLNDPQAPDWNVKFVGAIAIAVVIVAAGVAALAVRELGGAGPATAPAAESDDAPAGEPRPCGPDEIAEELTRTGAASLPEGYRLPSGCVVGA